MGFFSIGVSPARCRVVLMVAAVSACLFVTPIFAKRPDKSFRQGIQAYDRQEWRKAGELMLQAIQLDSRESTRKISITGMRYESYLPYFYLGSALYRQGRYEEARDVWATSREQGAIFKWRDSGRFTALWNDVVERVGPPASRRIPLFADEAQDAGPPPMTEIELSPEERCLEAMAEIESLLVTLGSPSTPTASGIAEAREAVVDAMIVLERNQRSEAELSGWIQKLEGKAEQLRALSKLGPRSSKAILEDLQALVEKAQAASEDLPEAVQTALVDTEIELSRNQPDSEQLKRLEIELLRFLIPSLQLSE